MIFNIAIMSLTCAFLMYVFIVEIVKPVIYYYKSKSRESLDIFYSKVLRKKFNVKNERIAIIYIIFMVIFGYVCVSFNIIRYFYVFAIDNI